MMTLSHSEREKRRKAMAELVNSGSLVDEVAKLYKVHRATVISACKQNQVHHKTKRKPGVKTLTTLALLFDPTLSLRDIGQRLGVSHQMVEHVWVAAKEAGIPGLPKRTPGRKVRTP